MQHPDNQPLSDKSLLFSKNTVKHSCVVSGEESHLPQQPDDGLTGKTIEFQSGENVYRMIIGPLIRAEDIQPRTIAGPHAEGDKEAIAEQERKDQWARIKAHSDRHTRYGWCAWWFTMGLGIASILFHR